MGEQYKLHLLEKRLKTNLLSFSSRNSKIRQENRDI